MKYKGVFQSLRKVVVEGVFGIELDCFLDRMGEF
jgi:hypothetical protein